MFNKILRQKSYRYILDQILDLVEKGKLKPGDKLPSESILTKDFGVSRPTVRQALSALEVLGILECKGGKGNYIKDYFNLDSLRYKSRELEQTISPEELIETRKFLEADIAQLAAVRSEPLDITRIEKNLNRFRNLIERDSEAINYDKLGKLDREFHLLISKATHNTALVQMMRYIIRGLRGQIWINLKEKSFAIPGRPKKYYSEHYEIFKAIRNRNEKKAREKMYDHIHGVEQDIFG